MMNANRKPTNNWRCVTPLSWLMVATAELLSAPRRNERGDVPGWVMITVMTAGLVAILTVVAGPALKDLLQEALSSVGG